MTSKKNVENLQDGDRVIWTDDPKVRGFVVPHYIGMHGHGPFEVETEKDLKGQIYLKDDHGHYLNDKEKDKVLFDVSLVEKFKEFND